jgi:hypothetical protein
MPIDNAQHNKPGYFQIALRGEEGDYPSLIDVSTFLNDFNLLYEFSRLIVDSRYADYRFSRFSTYRNAIRIGPRDRLSIQTLRVQSPIVLVAVVLAIPASAAAIWALTQTVEKIFNFPLNREIRILERDKLRRELGRPSTDAAPEMPETDTLFRQQVSIRGADYYFDRVSDHLHENRVHVREIEITHVVQLPTRGDPNRDKPS